MKVVNMKESVGLQDSDIQLNDSFSLNSTVYSSRIGS